MHPDLRNFLAVFAGAVGSSLLAVALTAFVSMPYTLQYQPGDAAPAAARTLHMT